MHTAPLGTNAPVRLPQHAKARTTLRAIITNLPEIVIINMIIWVVALAAILSFTGLFPGPLIGLPVFTLLFGTPAIWASWQTVKLALTSEQPSNPTTPSSDTE